LTNFSKSASKGEERKSTKYNQAASHQNKFLFLGEPIFCKEILSRNAKGPRLITSRRALQQVQPKRNIQPEMNRYIPNEIRQPKKQRRLLQDRLGFADVYLNDFSRD
tara:strand:+ start:1721 stop:2041 length:321 start_codon:yes stop_codon:yes gene_type:complete